MVAHVQEQRHQGHPIPPTPWLQERRGHQAFSCHQVDPRTSSTRNRRCILHRMLPWLQPPSDNHQSHALGHSSDVWRHLRRFILDVLHGTLWLQHLSIIQAPDRAASPFHDRQHLLMVPYRQSWPTCTDTVGRLLLDGRTLHHGRPRRQGHC